MQLVEGLLCWPCCVNSCRFMSLLVVYGAIVFFRKKYRNMDWEDASYWYAIKEHYDRFLEKREYGQVHI